MDDTELLAKINHRLFEISEIGKDPKGGWTRLAYSEEEDAVHKYAQHQYQSLGLLTEVDEFGNLFAKDRSVSTKKPWLIGTHLDTVPNGGNFDGVVGFVAGICGYELAISRVKSLPVELCVFRAEESTRFSKSCLGSRLAFGKLAPHELKTLKESKLDPAPQNGPLNSVETPPKTLNEVLAERGFGVVDGVDFSPRGKKDYRGYLEVHIEQARVLEMQSKRIGIVNSIRAPERRPFVCKGSGCAKAVSAMILATEWNCRLAAASGLDIVGTIGWLRGFFHGARKINTVPGKISFNLNDVPTILERKYEHIKQAMGVKFGVDSEIGPTGGNVHVSGIEDHSGGTPMGRVYRRDALVAAAEMVLAADDKLISDPPEIEFRIDIRSNDSSLRTVVISQIISDFYRIASQFGVSLTVLDPIEQTTPVTRLNENLIKELKDLAIDLKVPAEEVPSGAGHDAMIVHHAEIPSAMLFIPCREGISHQANESADPTDILLATKLIAEYLVRNAA